MTVRTRRGVLLGAGAVGVAAAAAALWPAPRLAFDTKGVPPGFRRLIRPDVGISAAVMGVGLLPPQAPVAAVALCARTFQGAQMASGRVAVAVFSDYFCPYCRILDPEVEGIAAQDVDITLVRHEVPLLGRPSQMAARAAIAAAAQGAGAAFRARLMRTSFVPNPAYLRSIAEEEGLDREALIEKMAAPETDAALSESRALFRTFGFQGTPGMVVGRTVVAGGLSARELKALISLEKAAAPAC